MRTLEKLTLIIYSYIVIIISVVLSLLIFGWLDYNTIDTLIRGALETEAISNIILGVCVVFILLSIKCIFFDATSKAQLKEKQGVLLENDNGKLMISKDTLENLVASVVSGFENAQISSSRVEIDKENNVKVDINLLVKPNAVIKEITSNLQARVKEVVKQVSDLDVKEVNVKVKNITPKNANA